jgi:hypothetical protein
MFFISKLLLVIAGALFILDGILAMAGIPNIINPDWGLPCPLTMLALGAGLILYIFAVNKSTK